MISLSIADAPDQEFSASLDGRLVTMRLRYMETISRWTVDLSRDDLPILYGRLLVLDRDLLAPFDFGIGGLFVHAFAEGVEPDYEGLVGGTVEFLHASEAEIADVSA